jgi:hypothetical protein
MSDLIESQSEVTKKSIAVSDLQKSKLFIATPCYGGALTEPYFKSILRLVFFFDKHNIPLQFGTIANESLVPRARNTLAAFFLRSDCTHLLFIDADIEFKVEDVVRLIAADKEIAVGAYPKKGINWDLVRRHVLDNKDSPTSDISASGSEYAINFNFKNLEERSIEVQDGLVSLKDAGTGFMLIKRSVFDKMTKAYPELQYNNDINVDKDLDKYTYALFDTIIEQSSKRYLSEDYTFCRRWQELGGQVWLDPNISLNHYGTIPFAGNPTIIFEKAR